MSIYKELSNGSEIDSIKCIRFCILSPDEIQKLSVAEIFKTDTYVSTEPVVNGLFDPRMGVLDHNKVCQTCEQKNTFCPGHFGHINLAKPVFYIQFFDIVKKLLKCVCFRCSKLLINTESDAINAILNKKYSRQKRWEHLYKLCSKVKRCGQETLDGCGAKQPDKIYREPIIKIIMEWKELAEDNKKQLVMNAEDIIRILKRISDKDAEILGFSKKFNRPEWMICTVLPVPPPSVRPSVRTDTGQRSEDDLTHKLCDIVKSNNALKLKIEKGASKEQVDIAAQVLQYHVATFIDNKIPGINPAQQRTGRLLKSLTERLKSKDGRIRGNLMGKRVDFSARSVITPDPNISIDELGVPIKIAMNLTFPEIVNAYNKIRLFEYVVNGPDKYPGAKFIRKGHWTKALKNMPNRESIVLEEGDVVDRHLLDGDFVLFNRQPSLHKYSMLCHRIKVMPFNTFRLNVSTCPCYNSDFDGDEMNTHIPQSLSTANELIELAAVPYQIISTRECKPIIAIVQDVALGVYRITKSSVSLTEKQLFNLMASNVKFTGTIPKPVFSKGPLEKWSGRQLMSTIIPKMINIKSANKSYEGSEDIENFVIIENGELKQGILDKTIYQNRSRGLVHSIFNDCGPQETRIFFDNTQKLICDWLVQSGFSVGISDLIVDESTVTNLNKMIHDMKVGVYDMIRDIHIGKFENTSISSNSAFFEEQVNKILNQTISQAGKMAISKINDMENRMINMVKSGSKGSVINVSQMIACLGQQNVDGKRIPYGFDDRTLPHYTKHDDGPESRGFVENSFISGLSAQEFFFHAMGGREGLIDTAVKSVTGDTELLIIENGRSKCVKIGDWIDTHLAKNSKNIQHYPEDRNMEFLELDTKVYIPTGDNHGVSSWGELTAVTRHDPGERLYEVTTLSGRSVTVAESKSLLIWNEKTETFDGTHSTLVRVGDFVPVTMSLTKPPVITEYVHLEDYLPKTEYIYGTDFNLATKLMNEAMEGRYHIPWGWWKENNGKTFTLPYTKKASLTRATSGRSNTENIKDGCIYPYKATREHCLLPDKFKLDKDFGIFIGLYIAEGSTHVKSGHVHVANVDEGIKSFVKSWFDKYKITYWEELRAMYAGSSTNISTTSTVFGHSTLLARFLDDFVGHGAHNKRVPDVAFTAPREFVVGLLNGYVAGDGSVSKSDIVTTSVSKRLTEGMAWLCNNRLGVFTILSVRKNKPSNLNPDKKYADSYILAIRSHWAAKFAAKVDCIHEEKNNNLKNIKTTSYHCNYPTHKDMVRDKIVKINVIDVKDHPKLYDVTVPSTLNFCAFNSLDLIDTSETGYIQRKLVKAMEDCKINYDYTVRNAAGSVIQFLYGEDGMDATKIESQPLPYIELDYAGMKKAYHLDKESAELYMTANAFDKLKPGWEDRCEAHFRQVLEDREFMIKDVFKKAKETSIMYPVSFMRMINNARALFNDKGVIVDVSPDYILDTIEKLCKDLYINNNNHGNKFMNILLRCYLSPKKVICEYKFNKITFEHVVQQIMVKFHEAIAHPSEMVGVIAAQSIGEPSTQMSGDASTIIRVTGPNNYSYSGPIGKFIDDLLKNNKTQVVELENHKDSVVLDLKDDYHIIGVSNTEKTSWKRISQVSRHPANGGMVRVSTMSGKTTTATLSHSFLKRVTTGIEAIKGSDLKVGDRIPVAKYISQVENPLTSFEIRDFGNIELSKDFGWLCGVYIADGSINNGRVVNISKIIPEYYTKLEKIISDTFDIQMKQRNKEGTTFKKLGYDKVYKACDNYFTSKSLAEFFGTNFGIGAKNKGIPAWVYGANKEFIAGLLQGYFDGDGNVNGDTNKSMIRAGSISEQLVDDMIVLLAYFGIFASKCVEISPTTKEHVFHTLQISRKYGKLFKESIGLTVIEKTEALDKLIEYTERDTKRSDQELIDKIPCLGHVIASIGKDLQLPGQSRTYGRWAKKESIGRKTLSKYIEIFEKANEIKNLPDVAQNIDILKQAAESDVVWDEIVHLEYLDDPEDYVYDFTVPGNDSFMVDTCILVHNTLNSVEYSTEVLVKTNGEFKRVKIGEFIDTEISGLSSEKLEYHGNDTTLGWTKDKNYEILSCDEEGKIGWKLIEAVTKHPPVNQDGSHTLIKIETKSGRHVVATKAKSFLKRESNKIVPVAGEDLQVGDYVPVSCVLPAPIVDELTFNDGLFYGVYFKNGERDGDHVTLTFDDSNKVYMKEIASHLKGTVVVNDIVLHVHSRLPGEHSRLPGEHSRLPVEFLQAGQHFLRGLIAGYGYLSFKTMELTLDFQQALCVLGISSSIYQYKEYELHMLSSAAIMIPNVETEEYGSITLFKNNITAYIKNSNSVNDIQIYKNIADENIMYDQVISIVPVESEHPYVYDFTIKDTRNFNIYNGLCMRDTFHLSGVSSASKAVRGVPRIKELLSVTKNIKSPALSIYVDSKYKTDKKKCKEILNSIETTYFTNIVESVKIYYDPDDFDTTIEDDKEFIESYKDFAELEGVNASPWLLRFEFNKEKMLECDIRMLDIFNTIQDFYDHKVSAMFSDDSAKKLVFRIKIVKEDETEMDMITELKALEKNIMENLILKGIKKINKVSMSKKEFFEYNDEQMNFEKVFEWVLETNGSNLLDILCHSQIDNTRTVSNNINEIYEILGIEAARQALYNEIWEVIKDADLYVNYRHLALLVDTMTNKGHLLSIDRHGINRGDVGPLAKSSFEETTDMLIKAGIFSEIDKINGVSANIMLGQIPPCGTGDSDIFMDEDMLNKLGELDTIYEEGEAEGEAAVCDDLTFDFTLPEKDETLVKKDVKFNIN